MFELAHDGTLFLDEVTEMDFFLQSKLLRALQTHEIMRVGDNKIIPINVRVIATTNKKPLEEIEQGQLRADLFYRLNVLDLRIPPLRERDGDPELLFSLFLEKKCQQRGVAAPAVPAKTLAQLRQYTWPGNVRELENLAEKYATLHALPQFDVPLMAGESSVPASTEVEDADSSATPGGVHPREGERGLSAGGRQRNQNGATARHRPEHRQTLAREGVEQRDSTAVGRRCACNYTGPTAVAVPLLSLPERRKVVWQEAKRRRPC